MNSTQYLLVWSNDSQGFCTGIQLLQRFQSTRSFNFLPLPKVTPFPIAKTKKVTFAIQSAFRQIGNAQGTPESQPCSPSAAGVERDPCVPEVVHDINIQTFSPKKAARVLEYKIFFANITTWGPLAQNFIFTEDFISTYQIAGLVETHALQANDLDLQAKCRAHGFNPVTNPAMQYPDTTGSHGGEAMLVAKHLHAIPINQDIMEGAFRPTMRNSVGPLLRFGCPSAPCSLFVLISGMGKGFRHVTSRFFSSFRI